MQPKASPFTKTQPITKPKQDLQPDKPNEIIDPKIKAIEDQLKKQGENSKSLIGKLKDKIDGLIGVVGKAKTVKDAVTKPSAWSSLLTFAGTGVGLSATAATGAGIGILLALMFFRWRRNRKKKAEYKQGENPSLKEQAKKVVEQIEQIEEVRPEAETKSEPRQIPRRNTTELHQLLQLRELEGRDPLLDASFGMFVEDEITSSLDREETAGECRKLLRGILGRSRDRVNQAAPLSVT